MALFCSTISWYDFLLTLQPSCRFYPKRGWLLPKPRDDLGRTLRPAEISTGGRIKASGMPALDGGYLVANPYVFEINSNSGLGRLGLGIRLIGEGWMTASSLWVNFGSWRKSSNSRAALTLLTLIASRASYCAGVPRPCSLIDCR